MKSQKNVTKVLSADGENFRSEFTVSYMQKLFPWFSETDILRAIELKGPNLENVLIFLNEKSGASKNGDGDDY